MVNWFLGALNFEPRATEGFRDWLVGSAASTNRRAVFVDYGHGATAGMEASRLRERTFEEIRKLALGHSVPIMREPCAPYSSRALWKFIAACLADPIDHLTVDLTCLTRVHTVAAGTYLGRARVSARWQTSYTSPSSYGDLDDSQSSGGWLDTLVIPFADSATLANQGMALGLLLLGHEGTRAAVALEELEPYAGIAVVSTTRGRPDLYRLAEDRNRVLLDHLLSLRMPGPRADVLVRFVSDGWEIQRVSIEDSLMDSVHVVQHLVRAASAGDPKAPVVIFPFGPKRVTFDMTALLSRAYGQYSWAVCPIHRSHSTDYSEGTGTTLVSEMSEYANAMRMVETS